MIQHDEAILAESAEGFAELEAESSETGVFDRETLTGGVLALVHMALDGGLRTVAEKYAPEAKAGDIVHVPPYAVHTAFIGALERTRTLLVELADTDNDDRQNELLELFRKECNV